MGTTKGRRCAVGAWAVLFVAGCGGGQQGGASAGPVSHTSKAGEAVFTYFGQPKPQLAAASGLVGVVAQAGATFSNITLQPPPNLADTYLVIGRLIDTTGVLYKIPYGASSEQLLYQNNDGSEVPTISAYGTVAFDTVPALAIESVRSDGIGVTPLSFTGVSAPVYPAYAVDGTNRLAFWNHANSDLDVAPGTGGTPTVIQTNDYGQSHAWNPAGTEIAYTAYVGTGSNGDLFVTPSSGGAASDVTPTALRNTGVVSDPTWNADGTTIVAQYTPTGGNTTLIRFNVTNPALYNVLTPSGGFQEEPCFSPDGSKLAFYQESTGSTPGVYIADAAGGQPALTLPDPPGETNTGYAGLAWSPFLPKETVVAASGSIFYRQAASGFLLSQNGSQFGSFVAFTANTPADAAIQPPAIGSQGGPMLFTITADSITQIGYMNDYFSLGTTITLTSTPSVIVSIDGSTGQVDLVAPSAMPEASPIKNADGMETYNAKFTAIFDRTGKNLAPSGASQLVVNPKTGRIVSFK